MSAAPLRRAVHRRVALLGAVALLVPAGVAATAVSSAGAAVAPPPVSTTARVDLPTSWPAVPVGERLQPWLAGELETAPPGEPLRVMVSGETTEQAAVAVAAAGLTTQQTWDKVGIVVGIGTPDQVRAVVGRPGVRNVSGDQPLEYTLDTAHEATRSEQALATYKDSDGRRVDGTGVTIAVIDSGIDGRHPMFADEDGLSKVVQNRKNVCGTTSIFTPELNEACFQQALSNDTDTPSVGGHGTHVAGIAAGYEVTTSSPTEVDLRGSAPGAKLVGLSVGAAIGLLDSNAAMNWVVEHQQNPCRSEAEQTEDEVDPDCPPILATNHSYGPITAPEGGFTFDEDSPTVTIQRMLVAQGVTPVWAAGNSAGDGGQAETNPPGMDPTPGVLMVASYNDGGNGNRDNALSGFSSRGEDGKVSSYPDIAAPGDLITSACTVALTVCTGEPSYDGGNYQTISGTSMATPYVAGVVAQLAQVDPEINPGEVEDLLEDTAHKFTAGAPYEPDEPARNGDGVTSFDKGHGLVDVAAVLAAQQGLTAPGAPAPKCTDDSPQATDPEGDATQFIAVDTQGPSQADLDIREASLSWDGESKELTFHITVTDLAGAEGDEYFRFYVTRESDPEVYAVANRDAAGMNFSVKQFDAGTSTTVEGSFDEQTNEVTVVLPAEQYGEVIEDEDETLRAGDSISVNSVLGQRDTGFVTATADSATGSCPFVVGGAEEGPDGESSDPDGPGVDPSPSGEPQPSTTPSSSPSPSGSPEPSSSPEPSESAEGGSNGARSIDDACPEGRVPPNARDDDDDNFHERSIDCMVWWEIAEGTSASQYDPELEVTREQMASFIARLITEAGGSLPENPENAFSDDDESFHHERINQLAAAGVVDGKDGERYAPKEVVRRDAMAKFLVNAYEFVSDNDLSSSKDYFSDDEGNTHEADINRSAEAGFTNGRNGGYEPREPVRRDAMASFLARTLDLLVEEGTTPAHV